MTLKVIDASAAAAMVFLEPNGQGVSARLGTAHLAAPTLIAYEIAYVCTKKVRDHPQAEQLILTHYRAFARLQIEQVEVDIEGCLDLARRLRLTAYDASYLWLARSMGAELVTLDQKLARAAAAA